MFPYPSGDLHMAHADSVGDAPARYVARIFAAQEITLQTRVLAEDRGIRCVRLDHDALRGIERNELTLF